MDENNRNFILAIVLSMVVLFGWQYFFVPKSKPPAETQVAGQPQTEPGTAAARRRLPGTAAPLPGAPPAATLTREEALAASPARHHRHAGAEGLDRAQGRADRRSDAQGLSRDGRARQPERRAAVAGRGSAPLLHRASAMSARAMRQAPPSRPKTRCGRPRAKARSRKARR